MTLAICVVIWKTPAYLEANQVFLDQPFSLFHICDVISEKVPYGGKNIIEHDQTPRMMRGV